MVVISTISFFLLDPVGLGICGEYKHGCQNLLIEGIGMPLFLFAVCIVLLSVLLRFLHESVFRSWLRFSACYLPIAALLIILAPVTDHSILAFDKEFMSEFLAGLFLIISLILIIYKQFHKRAK